MLFEELGFRVGDAFLGEAKAGRCVSEWFLE